MFEEKIPHTPHLQTNDSSLEEHTLNSLLDSIPRVYFMSDFSEQFPLYRGDGGEPADIFSQGRKAQGKNTSIIEHVCGGTKNSRFVGTTRLSDIAIDFPSGRSGYLYLIDSQPGVIDVNKYLNKLPTEGLDLLKSEHEVLFRDKIRPESIKGAWKIHIESGERRIIPEEFIENPNYKSSSLQKLSKGMTFAGRSLTAVAVVADGTRLYQAFDEGKRTGDYTPAYKTSAEIVGGWTGAIAVGAVFAKAGGIVCAPLTPLFPFAPGVCSAAGGLIGGYKGYVGGSAIGGEIYEQRHNIDFSFTSSAHAAGLPEISQKREPKMPGKDSTIHFSDFVQDPVVQAYVNLSMSANTMEHPQKMTKMMVVDRLADGTMATRIVYQNRATPERYESDVNLLSYITKQVGPYSDAEGLSVLEKNARKLRASIGKQTPKNSEEAERYQALGTKLDNLEDLMYSIKVPIDGISDDVKEILRTAKTTQALGETTNERLASLQATGTEADKQILAYVKDMKEYQAKCIEKELNAEKVRNIQDAAGCAFALANLATTLGNRELAKPLMAMGAMAQMAAGMTAMKTLSGAALLGPAGLVIGGIATLASLFCSDDGDELGEYLQAAFQQVFEQLRFIRQELFELRQSIVAFREELYERLNISFGQVYHQLSYMTEVMHNSESKADFRASRIEEGIEAILDHHDQDILVQARALSSITGGTIKKEMPTEILLMLPRVAQLSSNAASAYLNGASLAGQPNIALMGTIQTLLLSKTRSAQGKLFGYLASDISALNSFNSIINPYLWLAAASAYDGLRRMSCAQQDYDPSFTELKRIRAQGEHYINYMLELRKLAPTLVQTLLAEMKAAVQGAISASNYAADMHTVLAQSDNVIPFNLRRMNIFPLLQLLGHHGSCQCGKCALSYQECRNFSAYLSTAQYSIPKAFLALEAIRAGTFAFWGNSGPARRAAGGGAAWQQHDLSLLAYFKYSNGRDFVRDKESELRLGNAHLIEKQYSIALDWRSFTENHIPRFVFNQDDVQKAEKVLLHYRQKETKKLLQSMQRSLENYREQHTKAWLQLNTLLTLIGMPEAIRHQCPASPFPSELSTWITLYQADMTHSDPFRALPSDNMVPMLQALLGRLNSFQSTLTPTLTKYLLAPNNPELGQVYRMVARLYKLQMTPAATNIFQKVQQQFEEDMQASVQAIAESQQALSDQLYEMVLLERMQPLVKTNKLSSRSLNRHVEYLVFLREQLTQETRLMKELSAQINREDGHMHYEEPAHHPIFVPAFPTDFDDSRDLLGEYWNKNNELSNVLPFETTISGLMRVSEHFKHWEMVASGVLLIVGRTGAGKSALANTLAGTHYTAGEDEYGEKIAVLAPGEKEWARTSQGSVSETSLPQAFALEDYCLMDVPGFGDTRGPEQDIIHGIAMKLLQKNIRLLKGIAIVCHEDDLMRDRKFTAIRKTLEAIGHMIQQMPHGVEQQIVLVITRSTHTKAAILKRLRLWEDNEYAAVSESSPINQQAVKRVLSLLTEETILQVDVTEPDADRPLKQKIQAMPETSVDQFSFAPVTAEMALINQVVQTIVNAGDALQAGIKKLQNALLYVFKEELEGYISTLPSMSALEESLEKLMHWAEEGDELGLDISNLPILIERIEEQQSLLIQLKETMTQLHDLLKNKKILEHGYVGTERDIAIKLLEQHHEYQKNQDLFKSMHKIQQILHPEVSEETDDEAEEILNETAEEFTGTRGTWEKPSGACPGFRQLNSSLTDVLGRTFWGALRERGVNDVNELGKTVQLGTRIRTKPM